LQGADGTSGRPVTLPAAPTPAPTPSPTRMPSRPARAVRSATPPVPTSSRGRSSPTCSSWPPCPATPRWPSSRSPNRTRRGAR
jgi:hypothetical protein